MVRDDDIIAEGWVVSPAGGNTSLYTHTFLPSSFEVFLHRTLRPRGGALRMTSRMSLVRLCVVSFPIRMCRVPTLEDELFCGRRAGVGGNTKHESGRLGSRQGYAHLRMAGLCGRFA
jgi:hypothetical protein